MKLYVSKSCPNCPKAKENMKALSQEMSFAYDEVDISTDDGQIDALDNMVMSTPTLLLKEEDQVGRETLVNLDALRKALKEKL